MLQSTKTIYAGISELFIIVGNFLIDSVVVLTTPLKVYGNLKCVVPENIHTPPRKVAGISEGEGGVKERNFRGKGGFTLNFYPGGVKRNNCS